MTNYLHKDVFLDTSTARTLYHETAAKLPIIDFHTHLPEGEILSNHKFANLWELWLKHDHYKWRLMRACGVDEQLITGSATPWEKFQAFASIMPLAIGNPVHHWAHMELQRVFDIQLLLNTENAQSIWEQANQQLTQNDNLSVEGLLNIFKVEIICTTDDPTDSLLDHTQLNCSEISTKVYPTFRPDKLTNFTSCSNLSIWIKQLENATGKKITDYLELVDALKDRHDFFHSKGCRLSDHGVPFMPFTPTDELSLQTIFQQALNGIAPESWEPVAFDILKRITKWNHEKKWTTQLHLGPQRGVNKRLATQIGSDSGFDTMGSWPQTAKLIDFLNICSEANHLSRTIVYNLNPNESEAICCALQNFQSSECPGLLQYGPAWWHLDHVRGIREQLDILSSLGALGTSVGMLTDSRSFTSYVRHEYYRRLLCQYIGRASEAGEIPNDLASLKTLVTDICYNNSKNYFSW